MLKHLAKIMASGRLRRLAAELATNKEVTNIAIRMSVKLSMSRTTKRIIEIHNHRSYAAMVSKSSGPVTGRTALMSVSAVNTMRFMVFPKPITIDASKSPWADLRESREVVWRFLCHVERLLDVAERSESIKDAIDTLRNGLRGIVEEETLRDLIEEYVHSRMSRGTAVRFVVEVLSWKQRLLEMYIAERIHNRVTTFPRDPRKAVEERGLYEPDSIRRYFDGFLEEVERAVDANLLKAFKEYIASLYFQKYLYPISIVPFIEVPTWLIMNKMGLMSEDEIDARLGSETYFPDDEDVKRAREIHDALAKFTNLDEVVSVVNETLSPTLDDLVGVIGEAADKRNPTQLSDYFMERFSTVLSGHGRSGGVRQRGSSFPFWEIVKVLGVQSEGVDDLVEVICDILSRDRKLFEEFYLRKLTSEYGYTGVLISLRVGTEVVGPLFVDRWSGSLCEEKPRDLSSDSAHVDASSCAKIGTVECLVGLIPIAMRPYVVLREWLMEYGIDGALQQFLQAQIGGPKMDAERCKACMESAQDFEYRGLAGYMEASARDISDIVVGAGFMVACLGPIFRPHGIYLY